MPNRAGDWLEQAEHDLGQARESRQSGRHDWACFAAHQAAEKAVKALHLRLAQEAWGHVVARLLRELPMEAPPELVEKGRVLDQYYLPPDIPSCIRRGPPTSISVRCKASRSLPMPTRSLRSSVLRWPDAASVDAAVRDWARRAAEANPDVVRVGYFGSYARGDWGVGSDLDLFIIVSHATMPRYQRAARFDATGLPVPADVWVYTQEAWEDRKARSGRFRRTVAQEAVWVFGSNRTRDRRGDRPGGRGGPGTGA